MTPRRLLLWVVGVELLALFAPTLLWLYDRWTMSVWHNAHGFLVPPVVGYMVYQELAARRSEPDRGTLWGLVLLAPALLLHALDAGLQTQLLSAIALVALLPGLAVTFLGWRKTLAIGFPLAFMAFMLPIPLSFTERIHLELREIATAGTEWVMPMLGIPVLTEGTTLYFPHATLFVSDACSGFSTLYAALAVACLTAYTCTSLPRRLIVLVAAGPLAIAANVLRVILLSLVVAWQGTDILETFVHPLSGMMTFALALPVIFWLGQPPTVRAAV
jgi:exosortase